MHAIETIDVTHRFSANEVALEEVNLQAPQGAIYGFLGPNGAGKTTTIKLILGLLKQQAGEIRVFGKPFNENRIEILKKVGSMIESPSLYDHLTAVENLLVLQKIYRCPKSRIDEVLELVDLSQTGSKKAGKFSLGMKQRLSIAMALLHEPSLLILDEPTNGLDPNGIQEIRELLRKLNGELNITILISSHMLAEIERLVTHAGIINHGRLLFQGTLAELMKIREENSFISLHTNDIHRSKQIVESLNITARIENEIIALPLLEKQQIAGINRRLVREGVDVYEIKTVRNDLESIFFDVIGE
jgi:lantibiotic transport system ATP-binding protein